MSGARDGRFQGLGLGQVRTAVCAVGPPHRRVAFEFASAYDTQPGAEAGDVAPTGRRWRCWLSRRGRYASVCLWFAVMAPERNLIPLLAISAAVIEVFTAISPFSMALLSPGLFSIPDNDDLA